MAVAYYVLGIAICLTACEEVLLWGPYEICKRVNSMTKNVNKLQRNFARWYTGALVEQELIQCSWLKLG